MRKRRRLQFRVAASLKEKGVSLQKMRKSLAFLRRRKADLENPLASLKFLTDGETIFVLTTNRQVVMDTLGEGQLVFSLAIGEMLKELSGKIQEVETERKFSVQIGKVKIYGDPPWRRRGRRVLGGVPRSARMRFPG